MRALTCAAHLAAVAVIAALATLAACQGRIGDRPAAGSSDATPPSHGTDASTRGDAASPVSRDDAAPGVAADASSAFDGGVAEPDAAPVVDAGSCTDLSLAGRTSIVALAGVPAGALAYPLPAGGIIAAWSDTGSVAIQRFDDSGAAIGAPVRVTGDGAWGLAASSDAYAVLVSRGDILALAVRDPGGTSIGEHAIMGGVPHDVTGNEWFGPIIRAGRLDWNGSEWVSYTTVQRLWPDGIAHYGDALRTFHRDASPSQVYWDWGCSHSIEVRLTHNAAGVGPVCSSDCYPQKGIFFLHNFTVFLDSSGNCAGSVAQKLGGVVPVANGFFVSFISGEGRPSKDVGLAKVGNDFSVSPVQWITNTPVDEDALHLASYGNGMIAGWTAGGSGFMVELDASGAPKGMPQAAPADQIQGAGDFFRFADGDTGWVSGGNLVRLRACR